MTLIGRTNEIIAIPPNRFGRSIFPQSQALLPLSETFSLRRCPDTKIKISVEDRSHLRKAHSSIDSSCDTSNCLVFSVFFDRINIKKFSDVARSALIREGIPEAEHKSNRSTKGLLFNSEFMRDFEASVYTILLSNHIAKPSQIDIKRTATKTSSGGYTSERFSMSMHNRNSIIEEINIHDIDVKEVYDFIWREPSEIIDRPSSQFMKGISYVSQIFRALDNPIVTLLWSIAAIEAMLSGNEKTNVSMLEARLRAILDAPKIDYIIGKFRSLYRYRNDIFHGKVVIPYSFDGKNTFGFRDTKHSETYPIDNAAFAHALSIKILQRFIELGQRDIGYTTSPILK